MKRILTFILLCLALNAPAATVRYATTNFATGYLTNRLKVTPVSAPYADGNFLVAGLPVWVNMTNGLGTNVLNGGNYSLTMQGYTNRTIYFSIPSDDTNTYNLVDRIISGANFFNYRPTVQVVAGSNVTVTPSSGVGPFTISTPDAASPASLLVTSNALAAADALKAPLASPTFTGVINGNGSGLTGIPESGVTSLVADLALKADASATILKANNGSDFASPSATLINLVAQSDNTANSVIVSNGIAVFGSGPMGTNDSSGTPQFTINGNSYVGYRGTNIYSSSKENLLSINGWDRTQGAYIAWRAGVTNAGQTNSALSGASDMELGVTGDIYNRRLSLPGSNFNQIAVLALNLPLDFALSTTANGGTNGVWTPWYYDNHTTKTWFMKNTGGSSPRDTNPRATMVLNGTTGDVTATNGLINLGVVNASQSLDTTTPALTIDANGTIGLNTKTLSISQFNTAPATFGTLRVNATGDFGSSSFVVHGGSFSYFNNDSAGNSQLGIFSANTTNDYKIIMVANGSKVQVTTNLEVFAALIVNNVGGISLATNSTAPVNTSIIRAWVTVTNTTGGVFKMPLYQ